MKKGYQIQIGKQTWKELEKIRNRGHSYFFNDWLDLILNSLLSLTDNLNEIGVSMDIQKASQGKFNDRYMEIVKKYSERDKGRKIGERTIDYFQKAFGFLVQETLESGKDVLGEIYQAQITYGEHGQFFTPEHITECMSSMIMKDTKKSIEKVQTVMDPCCGSGRFLLGSAKENPDNYFIGQDIDERCCKMAVINLFLKDLNGEIRWGNSLTHKINKRWIIRKGGFIYEDAVERCILPNKRRCEVSNKEIQRSEKQTTL